MSDTEDRPERLGMEIPPRGVDRQVLLDRLKALQAGDVHWREHRVFGLVYKHSDAHTEFLKEAHDLYFSENGLNPMAFKSLQQLEREVVRMCAALFHGGDGMAGCMTSGGTESLLLTVLAHRNHARRTQPWIRRPEIVVPESAHTAFIKAGECFGVRIVKAPCGPDYAADAREMERRITARTILLVGSAPCYPYGVLDPIAELGELAARRGLPLHVDACLGGFFLPWLGDLGVKIPPFDFLVPGVTSLSADIHKYGYAAKGASLLLYRSPAVFADQVFADVDWCGGAYGGATLAGTRPGGPIAAAWAALHALGREGYVANARTILDAAGRLIEGVRAVPGLCVLGDPVIGVVAVGATDPAVRLYAVADLLEAKGWHINRLQKPESLQVILNAGHAAVIDPLLADLREAVAQVRANPDAAFEGSAPMYGLIANMPLRRVVRKNLVSIFTKMHTVGEPGPEEAGEEEKDPVAVPPAVLWLMRARARIARLFTPRRED